MDYERLPIAIIGAGPVGLAAVAHVLQRGETPIAFEASAEIAGNIRNWGHVRLFSPWEYTVDRAMVSLLEANGWQHPRLDELPTGNDLIDKYLQPFASLPAVRDYIHLNTRVIAVSRRYVDKMKDAGRDDAPFVLHVQHSDGSEKLIEAKAVIDASGTWHNPNPMGANGLKVPGEAAAAAHVHYGIPDVTGTHRARYANRRVMVIGNGHSSINALLDLSQLADDAPQTHITWVMRSTRMDKVYGGGDDDQLPARGELGQRIRRQVESGNVQIMAPFRVSRLEQTAAGINVHGETPDGEAVITVDEIITATGSRPDLDMLREVRINLDPALESIADLAPLIDPNIHSCGTVRPHGEKELRQPEKNFYIVGMKSYGRAPTFLLATGYEQVRSVVAALVGDWEAATKVELNLPETGVCNSNLGGDGLNACCGTDETVAFSGSSLVNIANIPVGTVQLKPTDKKRSTGACC